MMNNLLDVITAGSMKAVADIASSKNLTLDAPQLSYALKLQITNGYEQTVAETQEAMKVLGAPVAKAMLNASCVLFAINALKACGHLNA